MNISSTMVSRSVQGCCQYNARQSFRPVNTVSEFNNKISSACGTRRFRKRPAIADASADARKLESHRTRLSSFVLIAKVWPPTGSPRHMPDLVCWTYITCLTYVVSMCRRVPVHWKVVGSVKSWHPNSSNVSPQFLRSL